MRDVLRRHRLLRLSRVSLICLAGSLAAGCSADMARFASIGNPSQPPVPSQDVASGPQAGQADVTGAITAAPAARVDRAVLSPPTAPAQPTEHAHAPPPAPSPAPSQTAARPAPAVTWSANGWTSEGGASVVATPGDTVETLSRRFGVPVQAIRGANGLSANGQPAPGQPITIPVYNLASANAAPPATTPRQNVAKPAAKKATQVGTHVVAPGESLISIARLYNVSAGEIKAANGLKGNMVRTGQRLTVPGAQPVASKSGPSAKTAATPIPPPKGKPDAVTAVPAKGVQAAALAKPAAPVPAPAPAAVPKVENAVIQSPALKVENAVVQSPAPKVEKAVVQVPTPEPAKAAEKPRPESLLQPTAYAPQPTTAREEPVPEPARLSASTFRWPVRGRVIAKFGDKASGERNDGINLAVPEGTPVKAAENGVVVYAGNELKGYGNLVLVRHEGDWVTAYAHASEITVKRGDKVNRGQIIAKAGQSGNVNSPQLHFEVRKGSKPVDPMQHLAGAGE